MPARLAVLSLSLALGLSACGSDDETDALTGPATLIPAGAPLYIETVVSPEGEQAENLEALVSELGELPLIGEVADPGELLTEQLDSAAAASGVDFSFSEDVEPWLGERLAVGYTPVDGELESFVAVLETTDEDLARESLDRILAGDSVENEELEYEGVTYSTTPEGEYGIGVFDGHVVLATLDQFETAIDTSQGEESLAESEKLAGSLGALGEGRLGALYFDLASFEEFADTPEDAEEFAQAQEAAPEIFENGFAVSVGVEADQVYFEQATPLLEGQPELGESPLLAEAPGDSIGAYALEDIGSAGPAIADFLDRIADAGADLENYPEGGAAAGFEEVTGVSLDEASGAVGDGAIWVRGELPDGIEIAGEIEVSDEAVAEDLLGALRLQADNEPTVRVGTAVGDASVGFSVEEVEKTTSDDLPFGNVELVDGKIEFGFFESREAAEASSTEDAGAFGDTDGFASADDAMGDEFELVGAVDLGPILDEFVASPSLPDAILGGSSPEALITGFFVDKLGVVAVGQAYSDGYSVQRFAVRLAE